jgi:predicted RNase H-like nuclease (RuvC/YqgF family)
VGAGMTCSNCHNLQSDIYRLQVEIGRLQKELIEKERKIQALKNKLKRIAQICYYIINEADEIMSKHQPRSIWSYAKGAKKSAETVVNNI